MGKKAARPSAKTSFLQRRLAAGDTTRAIADSVRSRPQAIGELVAALSSPETRTRNAAMKVLALVSDDLPERLYEFIDLFLELLDSPHNISLWNATDIVCSLAGVDKDRRISSCVIDKLLALLESESMVTAGHAADHLWKIALARPRQRRKITEALLRVRSVPRDQRCLDILAGKTIAALARCVDELPDRASVVRFVEAEAAGPDSPARRQAQRFLRTIR